jgi:hypothetical protein
LLRLKGTVAQDFLHSVFSSINPTFLFKVKRWYVDTGTYLPIKYFCGIFPLKKKQFFTIS